jgi:HAD superfamily 5'-nucleotidase-like hydrolase
MILDHMHKDYDPNDFENENTFAPWNNANADSDSDGVYANSYVDLGRIDTVGFDYDYTLVTYTTALQELIYDMALIRLVRDKQYPSEMLEKGIMEFDPKFSIRGLAVDRENAWICHLSYTHKVAVAFDGREKVSRDELMKEYSGKRFLSPSVRKKRLKPLNDLFSMAECCLISDTVEFLKNTGIPFCRKSVVNDVLHVIGQTHISGDFHRMVAEMPEKYFEPNPYIRDVTETMKKAGKRLILASNSPFWYVDAGMKLFFGENWRDLWDAVIVSAGKPIFYTEDARPFREVSTTTGRVKFKQVTTIEPGEVYTEGCLKELTKCLPWTKPSISSEDDDSITESSGGGFLSSPNVLYIGDSMFADLVDAKREFGWTTATIAPEVGYEMELQSQTPYILSQQTIDTLLNSLRLIQNELGTSMRTESDLEVLNKLERLVSAWRDEQTKLLGNPFGSIFRARYQPSLFSHSLRRYCDLYMSNVSCLRHYSPQHRFYPEDARLLSHEIRGVGPECWDVNSFFDEE